MTVGHLDGAARDQRDDHLGLGLAEDARPDRSSGSAISSAWIAVEVRSENPLIDMTMMRIRGVWTTNLAAFLLGAGMYASFIVFPQFAQLPKSTGFGFGASVVVSGLYLLPSTVGMTVLGLFAGRISARFGSRRGAARGDRVHDGGLRTARASRTPIRTTC